MSRNAVASRLGVSTDLGLIRQFASLATICLTVIGRTVVGIGDILFHSLCSYQGKLKPSIAHWIINEFVPGEGIVLDPLGGVGTIAFEAALAGHPAVSNDKSPFPAIVASAKLNPPTIAEALDCLAWLEKQMQRVKLSNADYKAAEFGLNAAVCDYYHERTLEEILRARRILLDGGEWSRGQTFLWASLLHVLHGNRPYALSRRSHPITPFNPTGPRIYRT